MNSRIAHEGGFHIELEQWIARLLEYCRANSWAGYDPYDALNSSLFESVPLLDHRLPRLVLTQLLKRMPLNLRPLLGIPKVHNPKALALFLSAFVILEGTKTAICHREDISLMIERLRMLRSKDTIYWCWGYSFPWQTRTILVPSGYPNLVCTSFVATALLDAFDAYGDASCLEMAVSAAEYVLNELYWAEGEVAGFSYPIPGVHSRVHNANFLAAALLCRVYSKTRDERFLIPALQVARYSAGQQRVDGSWLYGEESTQSWIDNFHTGYNLCALKEIGQYADTSEFDAVLRLGFEFYRSHFFLPDGSVRYYHDKRYPKDIHCVAQSIITLLKLRDLDLSNHTVAKLVMQWALSHMWDRRGWFYYRKQKIGANRISYMRWSQAWMFLAGATLLYHSSASADELSKVPVEEFGHT